MQFLISFLILILTISVPCHSNVSVDPNGYIIYCPCMGRFGNQAEQFLGSLQFSKSLDRTLILPPFIQYVDYKVDFIPFENVFVIEEIRHYHRVISIRDFMTHLAPIIWKNEKRAITCYSPRNFGGKDNQTESCNPFEGSPFKEFWFHHNITNFPAGSLFYKPMHTDHNYANEWRQKFKSVKVIALVGAPSSFPTNSEAVKLSKYLKFTDMVHQNATKLREQRNFARVPYLAIHLRHGIDWIRACELIHSNPDLMQLFSSQQCMGDNKEGKPITFDLCLPSQEQIVNGIRSAIESHNQRQPNNPIKHIYIASDFSNESLWLELNQTLNENSKLFTLITPTLTLKPDGSFQEHEPPHFITDLYLLAHANAFIGNCISSFSAFVTRYRLFRLHLFEQTHFFSFHRPNSIHLRDEL